MLAASQVMPTICSIPLLTKGALCRPWLSRKYSKIKPGVLSVISRIRCREVSATLDAFSSFSSSNFILLISVQQPYQVQLPSFDRKGWETALIQRNSPVTACRRRNVTFHSVLLVRTLSMPSSNLFWSSGRTPETMLYGFSFASLSLMPIRPLRRSLTKSREISPSGIIRSSVSMVGTESAM